MVKVVIEGEEPIFIREDGSIVGQTRMVRGAIAFNKKGRKIDAFFLPEVTKNPDSIQWKRKDGTQRVRLYDDVNFLGGEYTVIKVEEQ